MRMNQEQVAKSDMSLPDIQPAMSPPLISPIRDNTFPETVSNQGFEPSPLMSMEVVEKHLDSFFTHKYRSFPTIPNAKYITNLQSCFPNIGQGSTGGIFEPLSDFT
jgi:hypothetical protein